MEFLHPSIIYYLYPCRVTGGCWSLSHIVFSSLRVTLDEMPAHLRATQKTNNPLYSRLHSFAHSSILQMHVFKLWEEAGVPGENPRRWREHANFTEEGSHPQGFKPESFTVPFYETNATEKVSGTKIHIYTVISEV